MTKVWGSPAPSPNSTICLAEEGQPTSGAASGCARTDVVAQASLDDLHHMKSTGTRVTWAYSNPVPEASRDTVNRERCRRTTSLALEIKGLGWKLAAFTGTRSARIVQVARRGLGPPVPRTCPCKADLNTTWTVGACMGAHEDAAEQPTLGRRRRLRGATCSTRRTY